MAGVRAPRATAAAALLLLCRATPAACESYVVFNAQSQYTNPPPARALASAVLQSTVGDTSSLGRYVWLFGGLGASEQVLNDLWRLDLQSGVWAQQSAGGANVPVGRQGATMVINEQRHAYVFGGEKLSPSRQPMNDLFLLHLGAGAGATPEWELLVPAESSLNAALYHNTSGITPSARSQHSATIGPVCTTSCAPPAAPSPPLPTAMYVFGGLDASGSALGDLQTLQLDTLTWTSLTTTGNVPVARKGHTMCLVLNSLLFLYGGSNAGLFFNDVHVYDIARKTWNHPVPSGASGVGRDGHAMVLIDSTVYVFGGINSKGEKLTDLRAFNIYAAISGQLQWTTPTTTAALPAPRWGLTALTSYSTMLLFGGAANADVLQNDVWQMATGCSGSVTLTGSRGVFSDGDGNYRNSLDCKWLLRPATANANVRLVLTTMELLDDGDRLTIYDGDDAATATVLDKLTGSSIPESITSSGDAMLVHLQTDAEGVAGAGFQAAFQAVCVPGYTWDTVSAQCAPVDAGAYTPLPAMASQLACPVGTYSEAAGASACTDCPAYSTTSEVGRFLAEHCACQQGYYGWDNGCRVCPEGGHCPGGNTVSARVGWCATTNSTVASPTFAHCCQPELCPGGMNARCDATVGLVGGDTCAVQTISWDTLHLVTLTTGTWVTFVLMLMLGLMICFCTGLSLGVRRAGRRMIDSLVVPVPASQVPGSGGGSRPTYTDVEPMDKYRGGADADGFDAPPRRPTRTPDEGTRGMTGAPAPSSAVAYAASEYASVGGGGFQSSLMTGGGGGEMTGASEEDVMVVSLDDPALGAQAPPPSFGATMLRGQTPLEVEETPRDGAAPSASDAFEAEGAAEAEEDEDTPRTKKRKEKKKKSKGSEEEDEGGEDEEGGTPKKKEKKKKKGGGGEAEAEAEGGDDAGKKKKKKKKDKE